MKISVFRLRLSRKSDFLKIFFSPHLLYIKYSCVNYYYLESINNKNNMNIQLPLVLSHFTSAQYASGFKKKNEKKKKI